MSGRVVGADAGVQDSEIQLAGNWIDPKMVGRYRHHTNERVRSVAAKVAAAVVAGSHTTVTTEERGESIEKTTAKRAAL